MRARVTAEASSFLRADAIEVLDASPDRVERVCPHAGPGRCGGCDFQHVALPAQRRLKEDLVAEQLSRLAGLDLRVPVEEVPGAPGGLGWRTRVGFAVDAEGTVGLHRHRSHELVPVDRCPIATDGVNDARVPSVSWKGARQLEVLASPDGGRRWSSSTRASTASTGSPPSTSAWCGRDARCVRPTTWPSRSTATDFDVGAGVFWQVHPQAAATLTRVVLEGLEPRRGERVADLYAGAGLFTVALARAVGPAGSVVAVERSGPAVADLGRNTAGLDRIEVLRAGVTPAVVTRRLGRPDLVVLDPARAGAGRDVMTALVGLDPPPRRIAYVSCEPAPFARDLAVALGAGWSLASLRAFDLFPMTEHVELVAVLEPPGT